MSAAARIPAPPVRRGACPSLAAPMPTGDGLLVRLRPRAPGLSPAQWRTIARLARQHGNGLIEVTARGNLQVRGLTAASAPEFSAGLAGIVLRSGTAIEIPPLAGLDSAETADPRPLAEAIEAAIAAERLTLAPKIAIVVDGGGLLSLADMVADIRLDAVPGGWRVSIAGDASSARPIATHDVAGTVETVLTLLRRLAALGPAARGRDLPATPTDESTAFAKPVAPIGTIAIGDGHVLGLGLPYGQVHADRLEALIADLERLGARDIRLAPHRALLILGLGEALAAAKDAAEAHGFHTDPTAPTVSACAGSNGCASARFDTHAVAAALLEAAPALFDGGTEVHVSGCTKGCAHPAPADLTLAGTDGGIGLVFSGRASDAPLAVTDDPAAAFSRLDALLRRERAVGETLPSLLARLGKGAFEAAIQGKA